MDYQKKFTLTEQENISIAKRNLVQYIYSSARLEGLNVTFPQTYTILEKARVSEIDVDTVLVINNLKHAWEIIFNTLKQPLTLDLMCKVHYEVARGDALTWGELRTGVVGVGGTNYVPPIPQKENVELELDIILSRDNPTEKAIDLMLWGMRSQLFWDGNKRNSMLIANKVMIENGCGIISIPDTLVQSFNEQLTNYYTTGESNEIKSFIYEKCIDGVVLKQEQKKEHIISSFTQEYTNRFKGNCTIKALDLKYSTLVEKIKETCDCIIDTKDSEYIVIIHNRDREKANLLIEAFSMQNKDFGGDRFRGLK